MSGIAYTDFATAAKIGPHMFEPAFNTAHLADKTGDLQTAYVVVQKALKNFPDHSDSNELLKQLQKHFGFYLSITNIALQSFARYLESPEDPPYS